jgi:hypothetical protein
LFYFYLKIFYLLFLLRLFYLNYNACPTIFPALTFRELDFFVLLDYLLSGICSIKSLFRLGKGIIYSKLGSEIKLWFVLIFEFLLFLILEDFAKDIDGLAVV